jgi:hypothetical protein
LKALDREQSTTAIAHLVRLTKMVRNYSVTHAVNSKAPPQAKLHDAMALADATREAEEFVSALDDTPARIEYQLHIVQFLKSMAVTNLRHEEELEMGEAYETGRPWQDFAQMVANQRTLERVDALPTLKPETTNGMGQ